jgi:hypothetical protein
MLSHFANWLTAHAKLESWLYWIATMDRPAAVSVQEFLKSRAAP